MALLIMSAGCAVYHAKPLDESAAVAALEPAPIDQVRVAASTFQHPLLAPIVISGEDGFTPDEIAVMAVITSPKLRALRAQRGVAHAQVIAAGILPNPQLGYTVDHPVDPEFIDGTNLGLSWEVTSLLSYRDKVAAAKSTASALDLDIAWQEWQAAQAARLAAFRVLSLEARLPLAEKTENAQAEALDLTRKAFARRYKTLPDMAAATESWSVTQDAVFAIRQELITERTNLNLALGAPPDRVIKLKAIVIPDFPFGRENAATLMEGMELRRLDLVALKLGYESSEANLRAAVKSQFPKIGLSVSKARDTSDVKTHGFGVTIDIPLFDRGQGQIAASSATRQQLFDEYFSRVAEARVEVVQILDKLSMTRTQLKTLDSEVPELEELSTALDTAMASRNSDAQAARDARNNLLTRRTEQAKLRQDILDLGVALEIATGRPLLSRTGTH
ncbi:MAG: outer membrane protein TolC [Verrucomicrobia bacterium]|nr:outer membrane protein TolC [Verrucomicrobiota bacterium]